MRAFTLITGLFLATTTLAAPLPRPSDDITDYNPFNSGIGKRLDLPTKLPVDLPTGDLTKGGLGSLTDKLPLKNLPVGTDITSVDGARKQVDTLTKDLPVKVPTDLSGVTGAASPALKAVGGVLQNVLGSLTKADESVKSLITNGKSNASLLVTSIQGYLNSALEEVQDAVKVLGVDTSSVLAVRGIVGQVQVAADQLVSDLEQVDSAIPGVPDLVNDAKSVVQLVQGLGL